MPRGVVVDRESGDVYVVDRENARVEKFGAGGEFLLAWGWGVADGHTQALQTCTSLCLQGLKGGGAGQFQHPEGIAVDNDPLSPSYHDVYVVDSENLRVEKFGPDGEFLLTFGREVNATTKGGVCVAGEACQAGTPGSGAGQFEPSNGGDRIAVGAAGTVFVGDKDRVEEFTQAGAYEGQVALPGAGLVSEVALDSAGDLYVEASGLAGVHKYDGAGVELGEPRDPAIHPFFGDALAVGAADELFVEDREAAHHILAYDAAGAQVASFDASSEANSGGLAVGVGGALYVVGSATVRVVSPPPPGPLVVAGSEPVGEPQPTTVTLNARVNPEGGEASYRFEYGTSAAYGASTPAESLPGDFEDHPASAGLSGLQPRTIYHFRIVASNAAGTAAGPDETFETLPPVSIDAESASQVTSNSAVLGAQIDPLGVDTHYRIEYGSTPAYGARVPVPDGDAGSGTQDFAVSAPVGGLSAGSIYHYRVVAYNALGTVEGPDRVFRTPAASAGGLLDGRAWEMVSPPDKHGASLEGLSPSFGGLIQASQSGDAIAYLASAPVEREPAGNRSFVFTQVVGRRGPGGWVSRGIAAPNEAPAFPQTGAGDEYKLFTPDLASALIEPSDESLLAPSAAARSPYRREADGRFTPLLLASGMPAGSQLTKTSGELFQGASPDLSHVVLISPVPLLPGVPNNEQFPSLYEWSDGLLQVVSVLPNGRQAAEENYSAGLGNNGFAVRNAISQDGSRIVWSTSGLSTHLYMRDMRLEKTVQLDVVEEGAQGGVAGAVFQTASSDGSKVFFTDGARLTRGATSHNNQPDLYMCEVSIVAGEPKCALKDISVDVHPRESANVEGVVLGASEDGTYVYFAASGALVPGAARGDCAPEGGVGYVRGSVCNLYVYDTVTGGMRLVADVSNEDQSDWSSGNGGVPVPLTVRVSPNGRYLAFMSERSLTGYDNVDANSGQRDEEVFLYDVSTGSLVCASCNPSGARPTGIFDEPVFPGLLVDRYETSFWERHWLAGSIPGWEKQTWNGRQSWYQPHYLSNSGRLFFNSSDVLVAQDTNGKEDVYEYEPAGVGACADASGCVGLISSGTAGEESALLDASETGNDVFFLTASRLAPQDVDSALDLYDGHVCTTASPCLFGQAASTPAACTSSDACRGAGGGQASAFTVPASAGVEAASSEQTSPAPAVRARGLTRAQRLNRALRACHKKRGRKRRACETHVRRLYGKGAGTSSARSIRADRKGKG